MRQFLNVLLACGIMLIAAFAGYGCTSSPPRDPFERYQRGYYFNLILKKSGSRQIRNIDVVFVGLNRQFYNNGPLGSGSWTSGGPNPLPKNDQVVVTWQTDDGQRQEQRIRLTPDLMPRPGKNDLVFVIRDDGPVIVQLFGKDDHEEANTPVP